MNKTVVKVVKSGVRFNAWDANGNKYTGQITTGARKKAYGNALEQRVNKSGKTYWWQYLCLYTRLQKIPLLWTHHSTPAMSEMLGHEEVVDFIQNSYKNKAQRVGNELTEVEVLNQKSKAYVVRTL